MEIKNAKIESTMLGTEDHGIMTCYLYLDYGDKGTRIMEEIKIKKGALLGRYFKSLDKAVEYYN